MTCNPQTIINFRYGWLTGITIDHAKVWSKRLCAAWLAITFIWIFVEIVLLNVRQGNIRF